MITDYHFEDRIYYGVVAGSVDGEVMTGKQWWWFDDVERNEVLIIIQMMKMIDLVMVWSEMSYFKISLNG